MNGSPGVRNMAFRKPGHRNTQAFMKRFGIRITMPSTDPMRAPHLLGENWEHFYWFDTGDERDDAFRELSRRIEYYRNGDFPSQILSKVER